MKISNVLTPHQIIKFTKNAGSKFFSDENRRARKTHFYPMYIHNAGNHIVTIIHEETDTFVSGEWVHNEVWYIVKIYENGSCQIVNFDKPAINLEDAKIFYYSIVNNIYI